MLADPPPKKNLQLTETTLRRRIWNLITPHDASWSTVPGLSPGDVTLENSKAEQDQLVEIKRRVDVAQPGVFSILNLKFVMCLRCGEIIQRGGKYGSVQTATTHPDKSTCKSSTRVARAGPGPIQLAAKVAKLEVQATKKVPVSNVCFGCARPSHRRLPITP